MISHTARRAGAVVLSAVIIGATFVPVAAEAGWRNRNHRHGGGGKAGAVAAAGIIGVIAGAAIASSAARADEPECVIEKRRTETPSGKIIIRKVRVCD